ncbi:MAG: hypothetical protein GX117_07655 [Candidatus Hydrogenedentes bacterium]|nr:hypothetical protein [Candidatus Hydrogenedentota bacterium]
MMMSALLLLVLNTVTLPVGDNPEALHYPHFPDTMHSYVWRNWRLVPLSRIAEVVEANESDIRAMGAAMGLPEAPFISQEQLDRTYISIIRANWHLLNYPQLLRLLDWDEGRLAYTLQEDDFLFIKLGSLKPKCPPLVWKEADEAAKEREQEIAALVNSHFGTTAGVCEDPPLSFVKSLSSDFVMPPERSDESLFDPRFCYSYFALYGDPLMEGDPFPENYLKRLAASGVNGVWLQGVLYTLSPFPWQPELSAHWEERLDHLRQLTERAEEQGMGIYLYMNEPRVMPLSFFETHPELQGVTEGGHATLCTSLPEVREYLRDAVASVCRSVPKLAGIFTISASENLTNCWSHHRGHECPRCKDRNPGEVIAEVNATIQAGIDQAGTSTRLIAWDWGWADEWAPKAIAALPQKTALMSVSEWSMPLIRGDVDSRVGEYSISAIGPGPRAQGHWKLAQERGLTTLAKIQANNTWELSAIPYIPAAVNVARHVERLRDTGVRGLMLSWTLGGHPSPNLELVYELGKKQKDGSSLSAEAALEVVAERRFGLAAPEMVSAWHEISAAFSEFPYHIGVVYHAPLQVGPANLLWAQKTGYRSTMVGIPYDDLATWCAVYPPEVFADQLEQTAAGFESGAKGMESVLSKTGDREEQEKIRQEASFAYAAAIHFKSVVNQVRFILARNKATDAMLSVKEAALLKAQQESLLRDEIALAKALYILQTHDSRIGFEATNQYFYTPMELVEKVLNCEWLLSTLSASS